MHEQRTRALCVYLCSICFLFSTSCSLGQRSVKTEKQAGQEQPAAEKKTLPVPPASPPPKPSVEISGKKAPARTTTKKKTAAEKKKEQAAGTEKKPADRVPRAAPELPAPGDKSPVPPAPGADKEIVVASLPPVSYLETTKKFIYSIGVRSFSDQQAAEAEVRNLVAQGYEAFVMPVNGFKGKSYTAIIGKFSTEEEAFTTALAIAKKEKINLSILQIKDGYHFRIREVSFN
jgi:hypothetical protein